jgi:sugar transferase (PEP-CTERM/EpsH1 system associated)
MKILFICHRFPYPPNRGGKIRPFNMVKHLSRSHQVTVCSLVRSQEEARQGKGLEVHCDRYAMAEVSNSVQVARMMARLPTSEPSSMGYFYSPELARRIQGLLATERWDLIFVHCSSVAQYVTEVIHVPKILDYGDMDSQKWLEYVHYKPFPLSMGYWLEGKKMLRDEKRLALRFDLCTTTTRAERETLDSYGTGVASDWFPNGVDHNYFSPDGLSYDPDKICFVGRMDYFPNQSCIVDFCVHVLPLIRALRPQASLTIIGADPPFAVRKLADLPGVTVTGSVPDIRPFLQRCALMVAPLKIARGIQNKLLESMASGVPVVTSPVAAAGVDAIESEHFLVAQTPDEQAAAALHIMNDPFERQRLAVAGRARMLSHHDWDRSMQLMDAIIERGLDEFGRRTASIVATKRKGTSQACRKVGVL